MIEHVSIAVRDLERAAGFYDAVLETLDYRRRLERDAAVGYATDAQTAPAFWLLERRAERAVRPGPGLHFCFRAPSEATVHAFYATALEQGGRDAGAPGLRPQYLGRFYGAFVIDLDGYKIEATHRT